MFGRIKSLVKSLKARAIGLLKASPILASLLLLGETSIDLSSLVAIVTAVVPLIVVVAVVKMLINMFKGLGGK